VLAAVAEGMTARPVPLHTEPTPPFDDRSMARKAPDPLTRCGPELEPTRFQAGARKHFARKNPMPDPQRARKPHRTRNGTNFSQTQVKASRGPGCNGLPSARGFASAGFLGFHETLAQPGKLG